MKPTELALRVQPERRHLNRRDDCSRLLAPMAGGFCERLKVIAAGLAVSALCVTPSIAQPIQGVPSDQDAMYQHLRKAREIAWPDLYPYYAHRCLIDQTYRRTLSHSMQANGAIEPEKVFDNLYFLGQNAVSAWALKTSQGIILFDTLNNPDEAKTYIVDGLKKLGLDPADIKYIVITHSHGDHFGGVNYLKAMTGARLMASKIDWDVMARQKTEPPRAGGIPAEWAKLVPDHDLDIEDGQTFKLGDTTLHFYVTPGHTPGTVSTIFNTTDNGKPHVVGFFGGLGTPSSAKDKHAHIASLIRFRDLAEKARVDVLIANHQTQDQSIPKLEELRLRRPADPNPFVIGASSYLRYIDIQRECTLYALAQQGQQ